VSHTDDGSYIVGSPVGINYSEFVVLRFWIVFPASMPVGIYRHISTLIPAFQRTYSNYYLYYVITISRILIYASDISKISQNSYKVSIFNEIQFVSFSCLLIQCLNVLRPFFLVLGVERVSDTN